MSNEEFPIEITASELAALLEAGPAPILVDVRERWEYDLVHLADSRLMPMGGLLSSGKNLPVDAHVVAICHMGIRSLNSALFLRSIGVAKAQSLSGGIDLWSRQIDPKLPRY